MSLRFTLLRYLGAFLVFAGVAASTLPAQSNAPVGLVPVEEGVLEGGINMPDPPLDAVLGLLEMWTGRSVLRPQNLPQVTVPLIINQPVTITEAISAIETALTLNGIAVTPFGERFLKVVPLGSIRIESPELIEGSTLGMAPSGRIVSKLFSFQFLRATEVVPQLANLLNAQLGGAVLFDKANSVLITDAVSNLQRVETLVTQLDQPVTAGMEPKFYSLNNAKASDIVNKMRTILQGPLQQQLGTATTYSADDRTNQVILVADPRLYPFFDSLLEKLDVSSAPNTRNEVIYLKHAAATDVATLVSQLVSGQTAAAARADNSRRNTPVTTVQPANAANQAANVSAAAAATLAAANEEFSTLVTILPDERSNAVVVSGTVGDIRLIKELISQIDVLLAQVRIEVVIAEVTLSDNASSGISQLGLLVENGRLVGFAADASSSGVTFGGVGTIADAADDASGVEQAAAANFMIRNGLDLTGIINIGITPRKTNANLIQQPAITTTHNKEATFFVGQDIPVLGSYLPDVGGNNSNNSGYGYRTTVQNREVGITLKVKPLIGNDGAVELEIEQSVEDVIGNTTIDGNTQPIVGRREMTSFVSAHDGEIIVLGGLQRNTQNKETNRLGPIPFIGDLFGKRSRRNETTDLIFFLRPVVLTNTSADNASTLRRVEDLPIRDDLQRALNGD